VAVVEPARDRKAPVEAVAGAGHAVLLQPMSPLGIGFVDSECTHSRWVHQRRGPRDPCIDAEPSWLARTRPRPTWRRRGRRS
jgi:hypothetical protein